MKINCFNNVFRRQFIGDNLSFCFHKLTKLKFASTYLSICLSFCQRCFLPIGMFRFTAGRNASSFVEKKICRLQCCAHVALMCRARDSWYLEWVFIMQRIFTRWAISLAIVPFTKFYAFLSRKNWVRSLNWSCVYVFRIFSKNKKFMNVLRNILNNDRYKKLKN